MRGRVVEEKGWALMWGIRLDKETGKVTLHLVYKESKYKNLAWVLFSNESTCENGSVFKKQHEVYARS